MMSGAGGGPGAPEPSAESLSTLGDMGFNERQARIALAACQGSVERAVDWLFSRHDNLDIEVEEAAATSTSAAGMCIEPTCSGACQPWGCTCVSSVTMPSPTAHSPFSPADLGYLQRPCRRQHGGSPIG